MPRDVVTTERTTAYVDNGYDQDDSVSRDPETTVEG